MEGNYSNKKNYRENFYDLNISGNRSIIEEAERLGFAGVSLTYNFDDYNSEISKEYDELKLESNILIRKCLEISCKNPDSLQSILYEYYSLSFLQLYNCSYSIQDKIVPFIIPIYYVFWNG